MTIMDTVKEVATNRRMRRMRLRGKRRYDGSTRVTTSRYQGVGGRAPGCEQRVRPAGIWRDEDRTKMFDKFEDLDIDPRLLACGRMQAYFLTINNTNSGSADQWLRGADFSTKLNRTLREHLYKGQNIAALAWWVEEFGDGNKPHAHLLVVLPAPRFATPKYRGVTYEDPGTMLEDVAMGIVKRAQPEASARQMSFVARAQRVIAKTVKGYENKIRSINSYMAKVGDHEDGADQKRQDLGADKVWDNSRPMSGYWGISRVESKDILVVDEDCETGVLTLVAEAGWSLSEGDSKPRRGVVAGEAHKIMTAGARLGRRAWARLRKALQGMGEWVGGGALPA